MIDQHEDILSVLVVSFAIQELRSSQKGIAVDFKMNKERKKRTKTFPANQQIFSLKK